MKSFVPFLVHCYKTHLLVSSIIVFVLSFKLFLFSFNLSWHRNFLYRITCLILLWLQFFYNDPSFSFLIPSVIPLSFIKNIRIYILFISIPQIYYLNFYIFLFESFLSADISFVQISFLYNLYHFLCPFSSVYLFSFIKLLSSVAFFHS